MRLPALRGFIAAVAGVALLAPSAVAEGFLAPRFPLWQEAHFSAGERADPAISGLDAAPARDGVPNLLKYALGLGPYTRVPPGLLPDAHVVDGTLRVEYSRLRHAPDLLTELEVSPDLVNWYSGWEQVKEVSTVAAGITERVSAVVSAEAAQFARVRLAWRETPGQNERTLIGWNFSLGDRVVPQPPTTQQAEATTDGLYLGPGLSSAGVARTWGATGWGTESGPCTSFAQALAAGDYFYFTVTPAVGQTLTLTQLTYKLRRNVDAPTDYVWQVKVGNGEYITLSSVTYTGTETNGVQQPPVDLISVPALRALSQPATFRMVAWGGVAPVQLGRDTGDALAVLIADRSVSDVLHDGAGDFDPWNATRWAAWYRDGRIYRPFVIDCPVRFAERSEPWTPDVSGLPSNGALFEVRRPGVTIDGAGVTIDARPEAYRNRTFAQVLSGGTEEAGLTQPLTYGFMFVVPAVDGLPANVLRNITIKGCVQAVRTMRDQTHPLVVSRVTFHRNSTGLYLSGSNTLAIDCEFLENSATGNYSGSGSNNNRFIRNDFRDNNYTIRPSYGDIVLDTAYGTEIRGNRFLPSVLPQGQFRIAVALYRNPGEDGSLREDYPRSNLIVDNDIDGYSLGLNLGARHGRAEHAHDLAREGRDYVSYNDLIGNRIRNTVLGIKVNISGNRIEGNTFTSVTHPIVLHAVSYSLVETTINDQPTETVALWVSKAQYTTYASWFTYQDPLMNVIPAAEKFIHVRSDRGTPAFSSPGAAAFRLADSLATDDTLRATVANGGTPRAIATGDFYDNLPGDEIAVLWEQPISRVGATTYYSILFVDRNGIEFNRSGRSTVKWGGITAGNFLSARGDEVAVFPATPVNGFYPVYVFRRGHSTASQVLLADNPYPIRALAAGNFRTTDALDEIAVIFESGPTSVQFVKPGNSWTATAASPVRLAGIAGGRFLPEIATDQVAAIGAEADPQSGKYPVYFLTPGGSSPVAVSGGGLSTPWGAIGAGDLVPSRNGDEVAVTPGSGAGAAILVYAPGETTTRRVISVPTLATPPRVLATGSLDARTANPAYERINGTPLPDDPAEWVEWGAGLVVLPDPATVPGSAPAVWFASDPADFTRSVFRITPLVR